MRVIGIDCATKSLAVSIVEFNHNWQNDIKMLSSEKRILFHDSQIEEQINILNDWITGIKKIMDDMFCLKYANVFDLLPGESLKGASIELRMRRLKGVIEYIKFINSKIDLKPVDKVLIEYQMSQNDKSRNISTALMYAFSDPDPSFRFSSKLMNFKDDFEISQPRQIVEMVGPALKGKVYFGSSGRIQNFRKKYMNNYTSNKAHSKYNFLKWLKENKSLDLVKSIPKKNLDDVADSFLMIYAWCVKNTLKY